MSEIIHFPAPEKNMDMHDPIAVLDSVRNAVANGGERVDQMVITWSTQRGDTFGHSYVVAGSGNMTMALGLLEVTKYRLIE